MEGRETIMLGSNNYLGLTGDERVKQAARDALETYGTGVTGSRLLNGTTPLHVALERELAEWMRDRGRDRLLDRLPVEPGHDRHDPRAGRHGDRRLRRPRLDPRRLPPLRRQAAALPPQPHGQAGEDAAARRGGRRRRARRRRRRLLDGGRRLRPAPHRRALQGLRRPADGRRGARGRRARRPRRRRLRAVRARGRGRPAHGHLLQEPRLLRRLRRRAGRRDRVPADLLALLRLQRLRGAGGGRRGAGGAAGDPLATGHSSSRPCSTTPSTCARACATSASR